MGINLLTLFDKLDDIVYAPINMITEWATEPLKKYQQRRDIEKMYVDSDIRMKEEQARISIDIRKETEKVKILNEIEQLKKDKELNRMTEVSEALIKYQTDLTKINVDAINAMGNMSLELRDKAGSLVYNKTMQYKKLQDEAMEKAIVDLKKIREDFSDDSVMYDLLIRAVDKRLSNIIKAADNFLVELSEDIKRLNKNIDLLTVNGQRFIEKHLDGFRVLDSQEYLKIASNNEDDEVIDV